MGGYVDETIFDYEETFSFCEIMRKYVFLQSIIIDSQNISIDSTVAINNRYKSTRLKYIKR